MLTIDGSRGEGGGQILRTSVACAALTGTPICVENIRAGRPRPGLMRQHLAALEGARQVCDGELDGAAIGATSITFRPRAIRGGELELAVGTAGSTMLVLQTILPCLLAAPRPSRVVLLGGTHNPLAPTYDFIAEAFVPVLRGLGAHIEAHLERPGFVPAGGGRAVVAVTPGKLARASLIARTISRIDVVATIAGVAEHVAERELRVAEARLRGLGHDPHTTIDRREAAHGPGNVLAIIIRSRPVTEVVTAFGQRGTRAEVVANAAVDEAHAFLSSGAVVGQHLADQLILPLALGAGGAFRTLAPTLHTLTQIETVRRFLDVPIRSERDGDAWHIEVG